MAYTDLTTSFPYKALITHQLWDQLAENDAVNRMFLSGTVLIFYNSSAPTGWTKSTANNDAALRVVSGSGGGTTNSGGFAAQSGHTHALTLGNSGSVVKAVGAVDVSGDHAHGATAVASDTFKHHDFIIATKD